MAVQVLRDQQHQSSGKSICTCFINLIDFKSRASDHDLGILKVQPMYHHLRWSSQVPNFFQSVRFWTDFGFSELPKNSAEQKMSRKRNGHAEREETGESEGEQREREREKRGCASYESPSVKPNKAPNLRSYFASVQTLGLSSFKGSARKVTHPPLPMDQTGPRQHTN